MQNWKSFLIENQKKIKKLKWVPLIRICREGTWTNNRLNCSSVPNLVEHQVQLIKAATSTQQTQTISKVTYQTLRRQQLEIRNHEETHQTLGDLRLKYQRVVSDQLSPVTYRNIHRQRRILVPRTQTSTWISWVLRAVATQQVQMAKQVLSSHKLSAACKTNINKCNNYNKCSRWCRTQAVRVSKEPRVTQRGKALTLVVLRVASSRPELNHVVGRELATAKTVLGQLHKPKCNSVKIMWINN